MAAKNENNTTTVLIGSLRWIAVSKVKEATANAT